MLKTVLVVASAALLAGIAFAPPICIADGGEDCGFGCGDPYNVNIWGDCETKIGGCCSYHHETWDCDCTFGTGHGWSLSSQSWPGWVCDSEQQICKAP